MNRSNYLSKEEYKNIEKVCASYKDKFAKLPQNPTEQELVEATTFIINDYIRENPGLLDLSGYIFNKGEVNASNMTLDVEVGYTGKATVIDPGAEAPYVQTYIKRFTQRMKRITFLSKIDMKAARNQNLVKMLEDAAEIRYKLALEKFKYIFSLVAATIINGQPIYISAATVNKTNLDSVISTMMDVAGGIRAIVGRQSLIQQIMGFSGWSEVSLREIEQGVFGNYKGATLIGLQDVITTTVDQAGNTFNLSHIPANQLILVGEKAGFEGDNGISTVTGQDVRTAADLSNTFFDYAATIVDSRKIGVYHIS